MELSDLERGRQWLWRNWRVAPSPIAPGSPYDDNWVGGFEELFPNDAPTELGGVDLPDHGETWAAHWSVVVSDDARAVLEVTTPISRTRIRKEITVADATVRIDYRLTPGSESPMPYLFKLHPALALDEHCTIDLPGGRAEKVEPGFGTIVTDPDPFEWPGRGTVDLDRCRPASSATNEFVYVTDLPAGWCGATDHAAGAAIRFRFPLDTFPYCWLFLAYGGWRGHQVAVLEPCTTYPKDLKVAADHGTTPTLVPDEDIAFAIEVELEAA